MFVKELALHVMCNVFQHSREHYVKRKNQQ